MPRGHGDLLRAPADASRRAQRDRPCRTLRRIIQPTNRTSRIGGTMSADWDDIDVGRLEAVCRQYGVSALFVFGSVARGESTPSSDIDLLYDLRPGARLGWEIEDLADALAEIFGRPVDLV